MKPILLIHGYSSEGSKNPVEEIYGTLPDDLKQAFGSNKVLALNLSRWISLSDGVAIDDISFAMDRALHARHPKLLTDGFHVVIHSTGALVVRNWIKNHCEPGKCPVENIVHLAGAHFGSGLAHIGSGQFARWARLLAFHTRSGVQVLDELKFGSWKSIDLALYFRQPGHDMFTDYGVQEFCIIGSQTPKGLRHIPVRYIKEDSSDNTVRTSAGNLNFNHVSVKPKPSAYTLPVARLNALYEQRLNEEALDELHYDIDFSHTSSKQRAVPYTIVYETAHFGADIGIVTGSKNRKAIVPLIKTALTTPYDEKAYASVAKKFETNRLQTFSRVSRLSGNLLEWNVQKQYEGHAQLIFRIRDQFGNGVRDFDIMFRSGGSKGEKLGNMIEDRRTNGNHDGTITFYLRTQHFENDEWTERLDNLSPLKVEVTGSERQSDEIKYIPLQIRLTASQVRSILQSFQTTIIDIELARLPTQKVFAIKPV